MSGLSKGPLMWPQGPYDAASLLSETQPSALAMPPTPGVTITPASPQAPAPHAQVAPVAPVSHGLPPEFIPTHMRDKLEPLAQAFIEGYQAEVGVVLDPTEVFALVDVLIEAYPALRDVQHRRFGSVLLSWRDGSLQKIEDTRQRFVLYKRVYRGQRAQ